MNISLKNKLAKVEVNLKKRDELAEGLHVVDFEQLKVENQTLNEKIEERQEELRRLRKKTLSRVQISTHLKEKLVYVARQNDALRGELGLLEQSVTERREAVGGVKKERDDSRGELGKMKEQVGISSNTKMEVDFEDRKKRIGELKSEIDKLAEEIRKKSSYAKSVFALAAERGVV